MSYDITVKRTADALLGLTLEVLGLENGRIGTFFGFEPAKQELAERRGI